MGKILLFAIVGIIALALLLVIAVLVIGAFLGSGLLAGTVAVIPIKGEISSEQNLLSAELSAKEIIEKLDEAEADASIAAIVFDIDSPGGSIVATKNIVARIRQAKKPTVAYINDIGTSGAFYAAAATKYVIADEDSITGSIGVISIVENYSGLLGKLGIDVNVFKEGKNKALGNPFEQLTEEQKQIIQNLLRDAFEHFKRDVKQYRAGKLDERKFLEISDGRIISGSQALEIGLIDSLGTRQDAIDKAAELAGIKGKPLTKELSKKEASLLDIFSRAGYSFGFGLKKGMLFSEQGLKAQ